MKIADETEPPGLETETLPGVEASNPAVRPCTVGVERDEERGEPSLRSGVLKLDDDDVSCAAFDAARLELVCPWLLRPEPGAF